MKRRLIMFAIMATAISICVACATKSPPPDTKSAQPIESSPLTDDAQAYTYDTLLAEYSDYELVKDNAFSTLLENTALLNMWVERYQNGIPDKVAVLFDGTGYPNALYLLESDGSVTYKITIYNEQRDQTGKVPVEKYISSMVVKRKYDYVFGADLPAAFKRNVFVIHHTAPPSAIEELNWNPETDAPYEGISPSDAERRAKDINERLMRHMSVISNIYGGGVYLRESILNAAADYKPSAPFLYRTVGAIRMDGATFYIVYGHWEEDALNRGKHGGSVTAVGTDGRLAFIQSMVDGRWLFIDDAEQRVIVPQCVIAPCDPERPSNV